MFRRWLIRSFFIAMCALCVGAWVGSYYQFVRVQYMGKLHPSGLAFGVESGKAYFTWFISHPNLFVSFPTPPPPPGSAEW